MIQCPRVVRSEGIPIRLPRFDQQRTRLIVTIHLGENPSELAGVLTDVGVSLGQLAASALQRLAQQGLGLIELLRSRVVCAQIRHAEQRVRMVRSEYPAAILKHGSVVLDRLLEAAELAEGRC